MFVGSWNESNPCDTEIQCPNFKFQKIYSKVSAHSASPYLVVKPAKVTPDDGQIHV